jgi:N utilization substance protein B
MSVARSKARRFAVQALYQWQMAGQDLNDIEAQFLSEMPVRKVDVAYFQELLHRIPARVDELDALLAGHLDRSIDELDPVERAVLRLGVYELAERLDIPFRVVINEAVELAKVFGAEQSHRYINGVLDKLAAQLRTIEVAARNKRAE